MRTAARRAGDGRISDARSRDDRRFVFMKRPTDARPAIHVVLNCLQAMAAKDGDAAAWR
jgi:hypothetical protein